MTTQRKKWNAAKALLIALILDLPASPSLARSGNELLGECKKLIKQEDTADLPAEEMGAAISCFAYIKGFSDGVLMSNTFHAAHVLKTIKSTGHAVSSGPLGLYCLGTGVTTLQEVRVVVQYLENNPKRLHESDFELVAEALTAAFPCK